jgi:hypothetical protein
MDRLKDSAERFARSQQEIKAVKMVQIVRRAMEIQARSKIKPNSMLPSLAVMSDLRKV